MGKTFDFNAVRGSRTALMIGDEAANALCAARIAVIGTGGVGGYAVEQLARFGANLTLVDGDCVDESNCNRQIAALSSTIGKMKAEVLAARCSEINPAGEFETRSRFLKSVDEIENLLETPFDFVVDAIDDVPVKLELIAALVAHKIPFVSSMGAGGKSDPALIQIADISKSFGCPLARTMRSKLREKGIARGVPCVFSPEIPQRTFSDRKIGSLSYIPAIFGCFCAFAAFNAILKRENTCKNW